tara:strand:+ start:7814 stop:7951 length:138 start_codon:yes stop_codon:yes gene_type:complete
MHAPIEGFTAGIENSLEQAETEQRQTHIVHARFTAGFIEETTINL